VGLDEAHHLGERVAVLSQVVALLRSQLGKKQFPGDTPVVA
jgi:hypothetical protein